MSDSTINELKRISAAYMHRTGKQLYLYTHKPDSSTRYVFNDKAIVGGAKALNYAMEMLKNAEKAPLPTLVDTEFFGENGSIVAPVRKHGEFKYTAAILVAGQVLDAMSTTTIEDAKAWIKQKREELG